VVDRLGEIRVPTLVIAGRQDFVFPPDCQEELAAGIPGAQLRLVDRAGHDPHDEQRAEVMATIVAFVSAPASPTKPVAGTTVAGERLPGPVAGPDSLEGRPPALPETAGR
jgi:hypothetical protein